MQYNVIFLDKQFYHSTFTEGNTMKYGAQITLYLDTFQIVKATRDT